jgi:hypothetical protein
MDWGQLRSQLPRHVRFPQNIGLLTVRQIPERRHFMLPFCLPDAFAPVKYQTSIKRLYFSRFARDEGVQL